jgi:hypothetical protein
MEIKKDKALMAFEIDIKNRTLGDWIRAHTSLAKPLHRYDGEIALIDDRIIFEGKDRRTGDYFRKEIRKRDVTGVEMGFEGTFRKREDRSLGLAFKPLRIHFLENGSRRTMYLIICFGPFRRTSSNPEWLRSLKRWIGSEN